MVAKRKKRQESFKMDEEYPMKIGITKMQ
jgi:hypothetical protein